MCSRCAALEAHVAELEMLLEHSIFATELEAGRLMEHLKVSPDQARILIILYKAKQAMPLAQVEMAIPVRVPASYCNRKDPDFRAPATVRQQCFLIRKKLGADVMANRYAAGVILTKKGRELVREALAA